MKDFIIIGFCDVDFHSMEIARLMMQERIVLIEPPEPRNGMSELAREIVQHIAITAPVKEHYYSLEFEDKTPHYRQAPRHWNGR